MRTYTLYAVCFMALAMAGCGNDEGGGSGPPPNPDNTPPTVSSTLPVTSATGVAINTGIVARFSEAMAGSTISATTFTVTGPGSTVVTGTVSYDAINRVAAFLPTNDLAISTTFTARVTTGATDAAGNALASNYSWTFSTGTTADTTDPTLSLTSPADESTGVPIDQSITAVFNEAMDSATLTTTTFTLAQGANPVLGLVTSNGTTATFNPSGNLTVNTLYTATITTGAMDLAGNAISSSQTWTFTTGTTVDTGAPTVSSTMPDDQDIGVPRNGNITVVFSEPMDSLTLTTTTFTVMQGTTPVSGVVTSNGTTATFNPSGTLASSTEFTATINIGAEDLAGNPLASNFIWTFETGATSAQGPAPVVLGNAGNFVILAKSGVSTTGVTAVVGDIGLSPAADSLFTGFSETLHASGVYSTSAVVTGRLYASTYTPPTPTNMTTAVLDMQTAYTDAAGRTLPDETELGAGNIDGMTLAPGLYKWGTGLNIPSNVTLDGGPNDVWIFQIAQNLTVGNGAIVTLTGGALAKNIFWQVAGQATLGTTSDFKGVILCQTLIAFQTGAVFEGRALAQTAVTLDATAITEP